jgi:formate hydrogenlyase subunit 4
MIILFLSLITAIFFPGIIVRIKSISSGRKGPGIFQPWKNVLLLLRKGSVFSNTTSYIFQVAPVIYLSSIICATLLIPFPGMPSFIGFEGDFVLFAYLLGLGKFLFIISAMDTGSSFEGMGANREALYSMMVEPAFFIIMATLAMITGHISMHEIFSGFYISNHYSFVICLIAVYLLVQITMIENSRMPVDDPKTHLELTMIHEVIILDHSGFDLALIHVATALKFAMYGSLIALCLIPIQLPVMYRIGLFFIIQILFAAITGCMESFRARNKLMKNPQFIITLSSVALLSFVLCVILANQMIK